MKVVIDTNVLLSAAWRDKSPEAVILWVASHDDWEWVVSDEILTEYREVLWREKFGLPSETIERWEMIITGLTAPVDVNIRVQFPRDQKDAMFLACAISANADYFITGDRDFKDAKKIMNTTILSVSMFKRLVCDTE
jgi:putative PIN family toxin of toxin-antitoxin system